MMEFDPQLVASFQRNLLVGASCICSLPSVRTRKGCTLCNPHLAT